MTAEHGRRLLVGIGVQPRPVHRHGQAGRVPEAARRTPSLPRRARRAAAARAGRRPGARRARPEDARARRARRRPAPTRTSSRPSTPGRPRGPRRRASWSPPSRPSCSRPIPTRRAPSPAPTSPRYLALPNYANNWFRFGLHRRRHRRRRQRPPRRRAGRVGRRGRHRGAGPGAPRRRRRPRLHPGAHRRPGRAHTRRLAPPRAGALRLTAMPQDPTERPADRGLEPAARRPRRRGDRRRRRHRRRDQPALRAARRARRGRRDRRRSGPTPSSADITGAGGTAHATVVDVSDQAAVEAFAAGVVERRDGRRAGEQRRRPPALHGLRAVRPGVVGGDVRGQPAPRLRGDPGLPPDDGDASTAGRSSTSTPSRACAATRPSRSTAR